MGHGEGGGVLRRRKSFPVMPGLVPGIHVFKVRRHKKTWMAGASSCEDALRAFARL
jgi:hypothetical protein